MSRRRTLGLAAALVAGAALSPDAAYADGMPPTTVVAPIAAIGLAVIGVVVVIVVAASGLLLLHFVRKSRPAKPLAPVPPASDVPPAYEQPLVSPVAPEPPATPAEQPADQPVAPGPEESR